MIMADERKLKTLDEFAAEIADLPETERRARILGLSLVWSFDYDTIRNLFLAKGCTHEEFIKKCGTQRQYEEHCRQTLLERFGYAGVF